MRYRVKITRGGNPHELELDADDEPQLRQIAASMGMTLVEAVPVGGKRARAGWRKARFDRSLFTQEVIALLEAGLSVVESVETLRDKSAPGINRTVLARVVGSLYEGLPLSKALEQQPEAFPPLYVATVASAERTGHLAEALRRYHHYDARLAAVRRKVTASLVYPAMVLAIGGAIMLFLAFYVVPRFSQVYASMKELPFAARLMLAWGDLVRAHGAAVFAAIAAVVACIALALRRSEVRARMLEWFWHLPRMAGYRRLFALTRFYRTLGLLLAGGMPIVVAMGLSSQLLPKAMLPAVEAAIADVSAGQPLSTALPAVALTTPVAERLLRVGEQTGNLAEMVTRAAEFCDAELDRAIDTLMRLVEPALMLLVGGMVGAIVFMLYMPIFQLAGNVG